MHILIYISRFGVGGIQTFAIQLAKELAKMPNVKASIFCHHPEQADTSENEPIPNNIEIITLSKNKFKIIVINKLRNLIKKIFKNFDLKEWLTTRFFLKMLQEKKVSMVHNNIQTGDENVYLAQRKLGIPYITTLHGAYKYILAEDVSEEEIAKLRIVLQKILETASAVVYLSPKNVEPFQKVLPKIDFFKQQQFCKIYNGLAAQLIPPTSRVSKDKIIFGMVARGHQDKGWVEVLEVFEDLLQEGHHGIELLLFADGDYVPMLMQTKAWHANIKYMGVTYSPLKEIINFDVGLLPSYHEEMPFTIIEYLACSKPCIATDVGAIGEMLESESSKKAGILVPLDERNKTSKQHLKEAVLTFVLHPELISSYAEEAKKAFQKFNIQHTVEQYYHLYQKALKK